MSSRPSAEGARLGKATRVTKACDFCHSRSIRCRVSDGDALHRCKNCIDFDQDCTFTRPSKKRGFARGSRKVGKNISTPRDRAALVSPDDDVTNTIPADVVGSTAKDDPNQGPWKAPSISNQATIVDLVEIYFEVVYPIFPLFHHPSLLRSVARGEYATDQPLFAAVMALCALSSARVRDGALFSKRWDMEVIRRTPPDKFLNAAAEAIPKHYLASRNLRYLQSAALLALASLQTGNLPNMHFYLGIYQMLCKVDGLHKEVNWPKSAGRIEVEERRRLFWSMYTLDIFSAAVFGTVPSCREALAHVEYPTETEDEYIKDELGQSLHTGIQRPASLGSLEPHWLRGWNFTTELYRVLEHILDNPKRDTESSRTAILFNTKPRSEEILDNILESYAKLPQKFKQTRPITFDPSEDRYSFQAANIAATIQLVRMTLFAAEEATLQERCQVVTELLQSFSNVPSEYLRAISTPLLYHLAGIGTVLGVVFERPLTGTTYGQVRSVLLSLADFLTGLETGVFFSGSASQRLRSHIQRMDENIQHQREELHAHSEQAIYSAANTASTASQPQNVDLMVQSNVDSLSPEFVFPSNLLEDWSWAFDFTQDFSGNY